MLVPRLKSALATLCLLATLPAGAVDNGRTLIAKATELSRSARSMSAGITLTRQTGNQPPLKTSGTILLMKPNYALIKLAGDDPPRILASDGKFLFTFPDAVTYTKTSIDQNGRGIGLPWWSLPMRFFFTQSIDAFGMGRDLSDQVTQLPDERVGQTTFHVLSLTGAQPMAYVAKFYIAPTGDLQRSTVDFGDPKAGGTSFRAELTGVRLNVPLKPGIFRFVPPAQAKLNEGKPTDTMLALGDTTPDFTLTSKEGQSVSLSNLRKGAKATLINFWYLDCAPCRIENPEFEKLYEELHGKGLDIVAIDKHDEVKDVVSYARKSKLTFPILMGGEVSDKSVFAQYRVTGIFPGTYLLDADGHIAYRAVGEDIKGLREALAKLGVQ